MAINLVSEHVGAFCISFKHFGIFPNFQYGICSNKLPVTDYPIQYGYIIGATISYYPILNGWKLKYGKKNVFSIIKPYRIADPMNYITPS